MEGGERVGAAVGDGGGGGGGGGGEGGGRGGVFFFSSRRRHTRFDCDWSSDVCSSDLLLPSAQFHAQWCDLGRGGQAARCQKFPRGVQRLDMVVHAHGGGGRFLPPGQPPAARPGERQRDAAPTPARRGVGKNGPGVPLHGLGGISETRHFWCCVRGSPGAAPPSR